MKKAGVVLLSLALAAGAAGGIYYHWFYKGSSSETATDRVSSDSADAIYVDSVSVLAGLGSGNGLIQRFAGVVEPQQTWEVKLENERTVKECYVKEGDEVKEGQKLFIYDTTEDEDKLAQAQIDLERCQNEIDTSTARKEQLEKEKKSATSEDQLTYTTQILTEENTIKQSQYEYKSKELEISQLKETIAGATVNCEMTGVVKSINNPDSSSTSTDSSDTAYITVLEVGAFRIKGTVNEQNVSLITEGMDMLIHSRVDDSLTWSGTITEINRDKGETNTSSDSMYSYGSSGSDSSNSSTNYPFYVELTSSDGLMLGQHVYMEQNQGQNDTKEGIWLDDYYFTASEDGSSYYVWAASSGNTLEKRTVTLGEYDEDLMTYQVLDGLTEEDYIAYPADELKEGLPVIYNDASADVSMDSFPADGLDYSDGMDTGEVSEDMFLDDGMESLDGEEVYDASADTMDGLDESVYDADTMDGLDESVYDADADTLDGAVSDEEVYNLDTEAENE